MAGIIVGVVSVGTSVPDIVLALTTAELLLWVRMTDLSDAVLFLAIGVFCVLITVWASRIPAWLRTTAAFAGFFALARSGAGFLEITSVLDSIAPFAFLVFMLAASIHLLLVSRRAAA